MGKHKVVIRLKRVYEPSSQDDGLRILVERLWPRGVRKESAGIDLWLKEVAPSPELRKWYGHDVTRWDEFRRRYEVELDQLQDIISDLKKKIEAGPITFVYAARDEEHNSALVLRDYLAR